MKQRLIELALYVILCPLVLVLAAAFYFDSRVQYRGRKERARADATAREARA